MSWLQKLLPPKIQRTGASTRKTVPEGLWTKCPACDAVLYSTDLEKNLNVCPKCGHHERLGARPRLDGLLDPDGRFEIGAEVLPLDPLKFRDSKRYTERIAEALLPIEVIRIDIHFVDARAQIFRDYPYELFACTCFNVEAATN